MIKKDLDTYLFVTVNGAGQIQISKDDIWQCGGEKGFDIGVSWGKHGYAGGVIPRSEARNLAEWILKNLTDK